MKHPSAFPDLHIELPPLLCADIAVYALIHACGSSEFASGQRFDKRFKAAHRFAIADTRGRLELTVPIAKPASSDCEWDSVGVSTHGAWWDVHRVALESAYGRTPYFEFYIDRFLPMLTSGVEKRFPLITDLCRAWDERIREILLLPPAQDAESAGSSERLPLLNVCRTHGCESVDLPEPMPYYQIRSHSLGFIPHLSVLDLIFNLGPEATLYLDRLLTQSKGIIYKYLRLKAGSIS